MTARVIIAAWLAGVSVLSCSRLDPNEVPDGSSSQDAADVGSDGDDDAADSSAVGGAAGSSGNGSGGSGDSGGSGGAGGNAGSGAAGGNSGSAGAGATGGSAGTGGVGGNGGLAGSGGRSGSGGFDGGGSDGSSTDGSGGFVDSGSPGDGGTADVDGGPIVCADAGAGSDAGGGPDGTPTTVVCVTVYDDDKVTYAGSTPLTYACDECKSSTYPTGPNACRNATDCSLLATGMVPNIVRQCALACRSQEPPSGSCAMAAECNMQCVKSETTRVGAPGLSDECGKCHTHSMMCQLTFCLSECAADVDAIECIKCMFASGCSIQFQRCTGLDPSN
jgi:hypothetical protein